MESKEALEVLKKYSLYDSAEREFRMKTRNETGRKDCALQWRIYADYLSEQAKELRLKKEEMAGKNQKKCPAYEEELKKNPNAHPECSFYIWTHKEFHQNCTYYFENIKKIDDDIDELEQAAECFKKAADHDDSTR